MEPSLADRASAWLEELGAVSDEPTGRTRTFLSPTHIRAKRLVGRWMTAAGLEVFEDKAGNLIGRHACADPDAPTIACGSHLETARNAGRYDGALGIIAGILAAEDIIRRKLPLASHLEIVAFSHEEGVRFQTAYLGSRFYAGSLGPTESAARDTDGLSVDDAITAHHPEFPLPPDRTRIAAYIEVHIEQGPVLEEAGLALGVVTVIAGQTRARVSVEGRTGHAGTTPMRLRRDALTGAAECLCLIEEAARRADGLVATVGELTVASPASNVIPGSVEFSLDIRDADDTKRESFCRETFASIRRVLEERNLGVRIEILQESPASACSPELTDALAARVIRSQGQCPRMVSGAGHDAIALAGVTGTAILFVRCREGLSHHPEEFAASADIGKAIAVLTEFLTG